MAIIDVNQSTFEVDVIERSKQLPVVVDFWAEWCTPCRTLGPVLERLAEEYAGQFVLAKLDVDQSPELASRFGVQGIPAVKAFAGGQQVSEFVGAQPAPAVRQFIEALLPNERDRQVDEASQLLNEGKPAEAEALLRQVLAEDGDHSGARYGLAGALLAQGREDEGLQALDQVLPNSPFAEPAARVASSIRLRRQVGDSDETALQQLVAANPSDLAARFKLGGLLALQERYEEALDQYLEIVRQNRNFQDGAARQAMVSLFATLGEGPLTRSYRQRLASLLYV